MSKLAIFAEGVSKTFRVYKPPGDIVWEVLWGKPRHRDFTALDDVSFTIWRGEILIQSAGHLSPLPAPEEA